MKTRWLTIAVLAAMWLFALAAYPALPAEVPSHWNLAGEVDDTMRKLPGAFLVPAIATLVALSMTVLPRIDPRRSNWARFPEERRIVVLAIVLFMALMEVVTLGASLGWAIDVSAWAVGGLGGLMIALGNYFPRIRSNWWLGIRTPWTLENERVWRDTHRVGGRAFVAAGVLCLLAAVLPGRATPLVALAAIGGASLFPLVYSYFAWRRYGGREA